MSKKVRVAINGFGRIGRLTTRILLENKEIELIAINDVSDPKTMAHLFKYDTVHGKFLGEIEIGPQSITINDQVIYVYNCTDPLALPWKDLKIDVVIESTGKFTSKPDAEKHIKAGARKVIISAPPKDKDIKQIVLGINHLTLTAEDNLISNASCTTNCAAPLVKLIDENFTIKEAVISTVHAFTSDQRLHDSPHSDLRRARSASENIIPTSTGASKAIEYIFPHLKGKLAGTSLRVPVVCGSITEFTCSVQKLTSKEEVNELFKKHAQTTLKNILEYSVEPLVSRDIIGNTYSSIFDSELTLVMGNLVRISAWYDNEMGYSNRLAELTHYLGNF